jgi:molybdopterin converting factor small subunit
MRIKTLFFGVVSDIVGMRESEIEVSEGATAGDVLAEYEKSFDGLRRKKILIAVDENHAPTDLILQEGQCVAFFTAVSGG